MGQNTGNEYFPDSAKPRAISVPIPDVAPVTMATGAMLWTEKISFSPFSYGNVMMVGLY